MYNPQSLVFPLKQLLDAACFPDSSPIAPRQNITVLENMVCITKMLFLLQLGAVIFLYWDFLGIVKVYLIEENLFLHNFSGCYVLSKVQLNDIVLSEEFQVPWKTSPLFSSDRQWNAPLLAYFKWEK